MATVQKIIITYEKSSMYIQYFFKKFNLDPIFFKDQINQLLPSIF